MGDLAAFLLTGGPGTGKTTVAEEMGELLRRADARYAVIDLDGLGKTHPPVAGGTFNSSLIFRNLAAIWPNYLAHGIDYMVFARILGSKEELAELRAAIPEAALTVARITSPPGTVARRLTRA